MRMSNGVKGRTGSPGPPTTYRLVAMGYQRGRRSILRGRRGIWRPAGRPKGAPGWGCLTDLSQLKSRPDSPRLPTTYRLLALGYQRGRRGILRGRRGIWRPAGRPRGAPGCALLTKLRAGRAPAGRNRLRPPRAKSTAGSLYVVGGPGEPVRALSPLDILALEHPGACLLASKYHACHAQSPHLAAFNLLGVQGSRFRS